MEVAKGRNGSNLLTSSVDSGKIMSAPSVAVSLINDMPHSQQHPSASVIILSPLDPQVV